jgi:hypothetical protein
VSPFWARVLADVIVVVHASYVAFVVFGLVAVVLGLVWGKPWARNPWLRGVHLAMIGVVVGEALVGVPCPLTVWENRLRALAGQEVNRGGFVADWAHRLIFFRAAPWVFTLVYCVFGLAVVLTFVLAPPRWRPPPALRNGEADGGMRTEPAGRGNPPD